MNGSSGVRYPRVRLTADGFRPGDRVELIVRVNGLDSRVCAGEVVRVSFSSIWVKNEHGNTVRFHADGRCIGWSLWRHNYQIRKAVSQ